MSDITDTVTGIVTKESVQAFVRAVTDGDRPRLRQLFAEHPALAAEIDAPRFDAGWPAIVLAANRGDRKLVDLLLEHGADVNARSEFWGRTIGVFDESPEKLRDFLIERGGLPEISEFVRAIDDRRISDVRRLLACSPALVERIDQPMFPFGRQAILAARDDLELVDLLLEYGADLDVKSGWEPGGFGVLDGADPEVAAQLIERGATVGVHAAAELGLSERLEELLAADPDLVHARGADGQTPLHVAATPEIIDDLLDRGAEIDARDLDHDSTPAQYQVDKPDNCRRLIERGASTDLFMAAALGDLELARAELDRDPLAVHLRLGQKPVDGQTPLRGDIYNWKLGHRLSPHQVAKQKGHEGVYRLLMAESPLHERFVNACVCADEELVRSIMASRPGLVAELDPRDRARFPDAVWRGNLDAVRLMLELGFDVDERDGDGPAIGGALLFGNLEMAELLLASGPDLTLRNAYGSTPLGVCAWASVNFHHPGGDYAGCARALLAAGAEVEDWMLKATPEVVEVLRAHMSEPPA